MGERRDDDHRAGDRTCTGLSKLTLDNTGLGQGVANCIQCTEPLHTGFLFESRGPVDIKDKGLMPIWFLTGVR
jgi:hypothetical protein